MSKDSWVLDRELRHGDILFLTSLYGTASGGIACFLGCCANLPLKWLIVITILSTIIGSLITYKVEDKIMGPYGM